MLTCTSVLNATIPKLGVFTRATSKVVGLPVEGEGNAGASVSVVQSARS
jgi:hypothetical protein